MSSFDSSRIRTNSGNALQQQPFSSPPTAIASGWEEERDPWATSGAPSSLAVASSVLASTEVPPLYERLWSSADPEGGTISFDTLKLALEAGGIKSSAASKIATLSTTSDSRVTQSQFYLALALLALAQTHRELSLEAVLATRESLPIPTLPQTLAFARPPPATSPTRMSRTDSTMSLGGWNNSVGPPPTSSNGMRMPNSDSTMSLGGWNSGPRMSPGVMPEYAAPPTSSKMTLGYSIPEVEDNGSGFGEELAGAASGMQYGEGGWALGKQDRVRVVQREEMGGWVLKHVVWIVSCPSRGAEVQRRYSDFDWLLECLTKRYPFRMLPSLPPKRLAVSGRYLASDDLFLERRRRALIRFLECVINHPVLRRDGLVQTFLTEPADLSLWRKGRPISLEEESTSRTLTAGEEMSIPQDLDSKLASLRSRITLLVDHWTRVCSTYDRIAHRRENQGADWARLQVALEGAVEEEGRGWRAGEVLGVERETETVAKRAGRAGELLGTSAAKTLDTTVEELKRHRELYVHFKDLLERQVTLSLDGVEKLKNRVNKNFARIEAVREFQKDGYQSELASIATAVEADQKGIDAFLHRRIFIRYCMWQEMVLVLFRSSSLLSSAYKDLASSEVEFAGILKANWQGLADTLGA